MRPELTSLRIQMPMHQGVNAGLGGVPSGLTNVRRLSMNPGLQVHERHASRAVPAAFFKVSRL